MWMSSKLLGEGSLITWPVLIVGLIDNKKKKKKRTKRRTWLIQFYLLFN